MAYDIAFTPRSQGQLHDIFDYVRERAGSSTARRVTRKIEDLCASLNTMPFRGVPRDDIRPGLRTLTHRRQIVIAYAVDRSGVVIHGIFQAGQDYETILQD